MRLCAVCGKRVRGTGREGKGRVNRGEWWELGVGRRKGSWGLGNEIDAGVRRRAMGMRRGGGMLAWQEWILGTNRYKIRNR